VSRRYTHSAKQRAAAAAFLSSSETLSDQELLERSQAMVEGTITQIGLMIVGAILDMSASGMTGPFHQGREGSDNVRHGRQAGSVYLCGSKVRTDRPRVRSKLSGKEVKIPAYETLSSDKAAGSKVLRATLAGVSSRNYEGAVLDSAAAVGVSKSSVSRRVVQETAQALEALMQRPVPADILVIFLDGIRMGEHMILAAIGVDSVGRKHVLGLADGATENARVVGDLLLGIKDRGLSCDSKLLFVTDGAKAMRSAIKEVFGDRHEIQRCREHKIRNVTDRVSKTRVKYIRSYMRAAWKLCEKDGIAKMRHLAKELEVSYPDAARSLLEGLEDSFTLNRLGLPDLLVSSLASTNIIESSNSSIRLITSRVKNFQNAHQALRWSATALLQAEKTLRNLRGSKQLWMLEAALGRKKSEMAV
jgi:putative transposase